MHHLTQLELQQPQVTSQTSQKEGLDCVYSITDISTSESTITNAGTSGTESVTVKYISSATVTADHTKNGYLLPTEAEWEYAARGGNPAAEAWKYEYAGSKSSEYIPNKDSALDSVGWYSANICNNGITTTLVEPRSGTKGYGTHEVEKKGGNALGLKDMSGNVSEWCYDLYHDVVTNNDSAFTQDDKVVDPVGAASGTDRCIRGGNYFNYAFALSVCSRLCSSPNERGENLGFRVCRSAQ